MGFGLIFAGTLFFLNFNVGIVDFLPDVIGCLFIIAGLDKLRDLDGRFEYSHRLTGYMTAYFALKLVISVIQRNYTLPLTFMASVIETVYLIVFFNSLYGAVEYTAERHGGKFMTKTVTERRKNPKTGETESVPKVIDLANRAAVMSFIFAIAKGVLTFLPETVELIGQKDELDLSYNAVRFSAALAKPPVMLACYTAVIVAAICYIVIVGGYFRRIRKDSIYIGSLKKVYSEEILTDTKLFTERAISRGFVFIFAGLVFLCNFHIDSVDVLPNAVGYILMFFGFLTFRRQSSKKSRAPYFIIPVLTAVSVCTAVIYAVLDTSIKYKGTVGVNSASAEIVSGRGVLAIGASALAENILFTVMFFILFGCIVGLPFSKGLPGMSGTLALLKTTVCVYSVLAVADTVAVFYKVYAALNFGGGKITDAHDFTHLAIRAAMYISIIVMWRGLAKLREKISLYV